MTVRGDRNTAPPGRHPLEPMNVILHCDEVKLEAAGEPLVTDTADLVAPCPGPDCGKTRSWEQVEAPVKSELLVGGFGVRITARCKNCGYEGPAVARCWVPGKDDETWPEARHG